MRDIITAINKKLKETFPDAHVSSPAFHKIIKPNTFIVEEEHTTNSSVNLREVNGTVRINFFPMNEDNPRTEFLAVQDKICTAFFLKLNITDTFAVPITDIEFETSDNVLIASFNVLIREFVEETGEDVEIIETEVK